MSLSLSSKTIADLDLADRARQGDQEALIELYQRNRESLFRHAFRMLGHEAAAQDVVQEAFARAIEFMPRTRSQLFFKAWIFRIATNLCLRELTRRDRDITTDPEVERSPWSAEGIDPARARQQKEVGQLVQEALDRLPPRYKQILLLRELEDLSYDELSQALQMSEGSVKITLHRARSRFAAEYLAQQLVAQKAVATPDELSSCPELARLLSSTPAHKEVLRHLEQCPACQKSDRRDLGQLFALLPPLPVYPSPEPSQLFGEQEELSSRGQDPSSSAGTDQAIGAAGMASQAVRTQAAGHAASAAGATSSFSGLTLAVGLAVTAVLGMAIGTISLASRAGESHATSVPSSAGSPTSSGLNDPIEPTPVGHNPASVQRTLPAAAPRRTVEEQQTDPSHHMSQDPKDRQRADESSVRAHSLSPSRAAHLSEKAEAHRAAPFPISSKAKRRPSSPPPKKIEQVIDPEMPPLKKPL